jgi:hypothetical protein
MPEVKEAYFNSTNYNLSSRNSPWINVSVSESLIYTVHCDQNCDLVIEWSADDNPIQVIETETYPLIANIDKTVTIDLIKWRYIRFSVANIASTPCDLKCQVFF